MKKRYVTPILRYVFHKCTINRDGDMVNFKCEECAYEANFDLESGKMKVINEGNFFALHRGSYSSNPDIELSVDNPDRKKLN